MVNGNVAEAGQIIATTIGGRNGQPKQVIFQNHKLILVYHELVIYFFFLIFVKAC